jgi:hypothetical protein
MIMMCPRSDTHLSYMIEIALIKEFALDEVPGDGGLSVGRGGCCRGGCFLRARECSCAVAWGAGGMARLIPLTVTG